MQNPASLDARGFPVVRREQRPVNSSLWEHSQTASTAAENARPVTRERQHLQILCAPASHPRYVIHDRRASEPVGRCSKPIGCPSGRTMGAAARAALAAGVTSTPAGPEAAVLLPHRPGASQVWRAAQSLVHTQGTAAACCGFSQCSVSERQVQFLQHPASVKRSHAGMPRCMRVTPVQPVTRSPQPPPPG